MSLTIVAIDPCYLPHCGDIAASEIRADRTHPDARFTRAVTGQATPKLLVVACGFSVDDYDVHRTKVAVYCDWQFLVEEGSAAEVLCIPPGVYGILRLVIGGTKKKVFFTIAKLGDEPQWCMQGGSFRRCVHHRSPDAYAIPAVTGVEEAPKFPALLAALRGAPAA